MTALSRSIITHYQRGEFEQADVLCTELLAASPGNAQAWHMRGILAIQRKDYTQAATFLAAAIHHQPDNDEHHINLGIAYYGLGKFNEAVDALKQGLRRHTASPEGQLYLGRCRLALGDLARAESSLQTALSLRPRWPEAIEALASTAAAAGSHDTALALALKTLSLEPGRPEAHVIAASALVRQREFAEAVGHYRGALATDTDNVGTRGILALLLACSGSPEDAVDEFCKALQRAPNDPELRHGLACTLLSMGRLQEAWPLYKARFEIERNAEAWRTAGKCIDQAPRAGQRVIAWADQGVGEQVMFASLIPDLAATGADIALECDYRLVPLLQRSFPQVTVFAHTTPPNTGLATFSDGRCCLSDAAEWLRGSFAAFPDHAGYLKPEPLVTRELRRTYTKGKADRPLVGISWRRREDGKLSGSKTLSLDNWGPILCVAGATFVNLQYGDCRAEIDQAREKFGVNIVNDTAIDPLLDLDGFAAQVAAMDLVITISNTTAHFAGALNRPTWTMVPRGIGALWHWFRERSDSPWYPSMTLLRQETGADWQSVIDTASAALVEFVANWNKRGRAAAGHGAA